MINRIGFLAVWLCCGLLHAELVPAQSKSVVGNSKSKSPGQPTIVKPHTVKPLIRFIGDSGFSQPKRTTGQKQPITMSYSTSFSTGATSQNGICAGPYDTPCRGCDCCQAGRHIVNTLLGRSCCCKYFEPNCERPFGSFMRQTLQAQIHSGIESQLVFNDFHFFLEPRSQTWQLTESGKSQADKIARLTYGMPGQVVIEATGSPDFDMSRRHAAFVAFQERGVAIGLENLVVGKPRAFGLSGVDAEYIYPKRFEPIELRPTQSQAATIAPSVGGARGGGN